MNSRGDKIKKRIKWTISKLAGVNQIRHELLKVNIKKLGGRNLLKKHGGNRDSF